MIDAGAAAATLQGVRTIRPATTADDFAAFGALVREYVASLPFVLDFQDIEGELAALEQEYGPPGGAALLVELAGVPVGCVGIRALEPPAIAELKRMYLRPEARGRGLGRALAENALETAARLGYERVRLDTVADMVAAVELYRKLGFVEIEPYRHNPLRTARFYEAVLREAGSR
ncbi:MAG TPA: GNAT family N-acetyltransferase [Acidimicrobiales bacterium]|nr:GNAT family N-acetyltransferase [Acidimicrobiales bacterium]